MPRPVTVTISHELGLEGARHRVRDGFAQMRQHLVGGRMLKFQEQWTSDDRLEFEAKGLGQHITGVIDIFPEHVRFEVNLPGLLATLAETIAGNVEKQGRILLEKK